MSNLGYASGAIRVAAGSTVVWTNEDGIRHTVTPAGADLDFGGELHRDGGALIARFDKPGTFGFFCSVHSHMVGAVIVSWRRSVLDYDT